MSAGAAIALLSAGAANAAQQPPGPRPPALTYSGPVPEQFTISPEMGSRFGVLFYSNGDKFEGQVRDNAPGGVGVFSWANNDRYEGEYDGNMNGLGVFYFRLDCGVGCADKERAGEWVNGDLTARGVVIESNGTRRGF